MNTNQTPQPTQNPNAAFGESTDIQNAVIEDNRYVAQSQVCETVDTVVPLGMRYEMLKAIETVDRRVNGVDEYVAEKLGYFPAKCSIEQKKEGIKCLCDAFSAEQVDAIATIIHNIEEKGHATIIGDQTGIGKGRSQPLEAKILTPDGWMTMGDMKVGSKVFSVDGSVTEVIGVFPQGKIDIYEIVFSDGSKTECSADHLWTTRNKQQKHDEKKNPGSFWSQYKVVETKELMKPAKIKAQYSIPMVESVQFKYREVPLDAYFVGLLLGDGNIRKHSVQIIAPDEEILQSVKNCLPENYVAKDRGRKHFDISRTIRKGSTSNPVLKALRELNLTGKTAEYKFIPECYKINSAEVRLAILQGLMDTDGYVNSKGSCMYYTVSDQLANDIDFIVRSLGGITTRGIKKSTYTKYNSTEKLIGKPCHVIYIKLPNGINPFRLIRKVNRVKDFIKYFPQRIIRSIKLIGKKEAQCIKVSHPSSLYVTDDFIVTHNTAAAVVRYGTMIGLPTIFLTEKPNLFSDFFRDVISIGSDDNIPQFFIQDKKKEKKVVATNAEILKTIKDDIENGDFDEDGFSADTVFENTDEAKSHLPKLISIYREKYFDDEIILVDEYKSNKYYNQDILNKKLLRPFIVNGASAKTDIKNEKGDIIYRGAPANVTKEIIASGKVPSEYSFVLATYSQFSSSRETAKKDFLRQISQNAIIVMDESHNASGSSNSGVFLMDILSQSKGACFLSATFAKRPDNMPIYASKTVIQDVNMTMEQLVSAIVKGGVALQEILSSQLVLEGEMIRRERSFEGIEVDYINLDSSQDAVRPNWNKEIEHRAISDTATDILRDIINFQLNFVNPEIAEMDEIAKAEYAEVEKRKGTSEAGISNPPIFSGIFQLISQLLFSIKAEVLAEIAINDLKHGRKPVIAFANTMESFLNAMTDDEGNLIEVGDRIGTDFSLVFKRRMQSIVKYTVTKYEEVEGQEELKVVKEYKMLNPLEMSEAYQKEWNRIMDKINNASIGISISPIDIIVDKIQAAGFSTAEVTGRDRSLKITGEGTAIVQQRQKMNANDAFRMYNANEVDCLLINQSGSTGASAHAIKVKGKVDVVNKDASGNKIIPTSLYPKDEVKQRVMLILQAELDINKEVQKRGRINRTGQEFKPIYRYITSAIPAEKRLMMMLQKKLKSLDANTTSNQKQSTSVVNVPDFLNKYGDIVVREFLKENPEFNKMIDDPLDLLSASGAGEDEGKQKDIPDAAHKVSGRVAILSTKMQEDFYSEMAQRYSGLEDYLRQMNEYDLEVESMPLEAETVARKIKIAGKGGTSVFSRDTVLEKCKVNNLKKPFKKIEVTQLLKDALVDKNEDEITADKLKELQIKEMKDFLTAAKEREINDNEVHYKAVIENIPNERNYTKLLTDSARAAFYKERVDAINDAHEKSDARIVDAFENKADQLEDWFKYFFVGKVCEYPSVGYKDTGVSFKSICLGFQVNYKAKNPYAPSALKLRFVIASGLKYVAIPLSKLDSINQVYTLTNQKISRYEQMNVLDNWDELIKSATTDKITQYIVTGNILQGYADSTFSSGKLISYTTSTGGVKKGILMPYGYSPEQHERDSEKRSDTVMVPLARAKKVIMSMLNGRGVSTNDHLYIAKENYGDNFKILVPLNKKLGAKYYEDAKLKSMTIEGTFNKAAAQMTATVTDNSIEMLLDYLSKKFNLSVEIHERELEILGITVSDYDDEEVFVSQSDKFLEGLQKPDTDAVQEMQQKATEDEQQKRAAEEAIAKAKEEELAKAAEEALEETQLDMQEREAQLLKIKKANAKIKLLKFLSLLQAGVVEKMARGGEVNTWVPGAGYAMSGAVQQLSFSKVDYDVNVNLKNLEVDVNIKKNDSVDGYALSDTGVNWNQHHWGYMIYPEDKEQLFAVLRALRVQFSEQRVENALAGKKYEQGGKINSFFSNIKNKTSQLYNQGKTAVDKKLHDRKRATALEVLSEMGMRANVSRQEEERVINPAYDLVHDKYAMGGELKWRLEQIKKTEGNDVVVAYKSNFLPIGKSSVNFFDLTEKEKDKGYNFRKNIQGGYTIAEEKGTGNIYVLKGGFGIKIRNGKNK